MHAYPNPIPPLIPRTVILLTKDLKVEMKSRLTSGPQFHQAPLRQQTANHAPQSRQPSSRPTLRLAYHVARQVIRTPDIIFWERDREFRKLELFRRLQIQT